MPKREAYKNKEDTNRRTNSKHNKHTRMETAYIISGIVGALLLAIGGYLISFGDHKISSIWFFFAGSVCLCLSAALYLHGYAKKENQPTSPASDLVSSVAAPKIVTPPIAPLVEPKATKAPPITEQDIAIPPPPSDPSLTTRTPTQIIDEIYKDASPFVNKADLERSFIGMKVKWKLPLLKKMGTNTAGNFSALFSGDKANSSSVSITIPFKSSEQLRMSAEGDLFLVCGTIKSVNPLVVFLDDGKAERTGK
jgi:hypothetical protein